MSEINGCFDARCLWDSLSGSSSEEGLARVWGGLKTPRYFKTEGQPAVETQIRSLSCKVRASTLGQAFQGHAAVRRLTLEDHHLLSEFARDLPLEPRAKLLPEESLEAAMSRESSEEVARLIVKEAPGIAMEKTLAGSERSSSTVDGIGVEGVQVSGSQGILRRGRMAGQVECSSAELLLMLWAPQVGARGTPSRENFVQAPLRF